MTSKYHGPIATILLLTLYLSAPAHAQDILPFPPAPSASQAGVTIESSTYKKRVEPKRLPDDAPNILIILIDDVGPGTPSTFGGEISTPALSRIANLGISYNCFHSTAMCSPTRAALLTGRNHTRVGNGQISAIAEIEKQGRLDNTIVLYIWGDNGSSSEGLYGTISEQLAQNGISTKISQHLTALEELGGLDALGGPKTDNMYHAGWAWADSTLYQGTKLQGAYFGGTRQPMAVSWPKGIGHNSTPRSQFHHVNDIIPTIYEVLGIQPPQVVNGVAQDTFDGVSMGYTFADANADGRKTTIEVESNLVDKIGGAMDVTLRVNGAVVGQSRVPAAMSLHFTSNASFDIGADRDSPVSLDYYDQAPFEFNGTIGKTQN
jgi:hypothetical protein